MATNAPNTRVQELSDALIEIFKTYPSLSIDELNAKLTVFEERFPDVDELLDDEEIEDKCREALNDYVTPIDTMLDEFDAGGKEVSIQDDDQSELIKRSDTESESFVLSKAARIVLPVSGSFDPTKFYTMFNRLWIHFRNGAYSTGRYGDPNVPDVVLDNIESEMYPQFEQIAIAFCDHDGNGKGTELAIVHQNSGRYIVVKRMYDLDEHFIRYPRLLSLKGLLPFLFSCMHCPEHIFSFFILAEPSEHSPKDEGEEESSEDENKDPQTIA